MASEDDFDDIVVGGGTSGAVVAARLSEDPGRRVLLLEAGPDFERADDLPAPLRGSRAPVMAGFNWDQRAALGDPDDAASKAVFPYPVGRVIGGSSAINAAIALRPLPQDFAAWAEAAGPDWRWDQVLPAFRALEHDLDFSGPAHGDRGPVPIRRPQRLAPWAQAFREACVQSGLPLLPDLNDGGDGPGVGLLPANRVDGLRVSSAVAYRMPARGRRNLDVRGGHVVQRVLFEGRRATGVQVLHQGRHITLQGRRVVLCAGAIQTPALLMRSGIGPAAVCRAHAGACIAERPGVGARLLDHVAVTLWMKPREGSPADEPALAQHQALARLDAGGARAALNLLPVTGADVSGMPALAALLGGPRAHALSVMLARPRSHGRVSLDPDGEACIALNIGADAQDIDDLAHGVRSAWALARSAALATEASPVAPWNDATVASDTLLRAAVRRWASGTWHAAGTARMGPADDPGAVVDSHGHVHDVDSLLVADASVMPTLPSTPTALACLMLAERIAAWLRQAP